MSEIAPVYFDEDDEDAEFEAQLRASGLLPPEVSLAPAPTPVEVPPAEKPKKPRYFCAGAKRVDERSGRKNCEYKSHERWYGACPSCFGYYDCLPYRKGANEKERATLSAASLASVKPSICIPTGMKELDRVINGGVVLSKTLLIGGERGSGKPVACDTPVPTPTGWSTQGDLREGDLVIGADGRPACVLGTTGPMRDRPCFRLHFSDGTSIVSDAVHPWPTYSSRREVYFRADSALSRHFPRTTCSTTEIAETIEDGHYIPFAFGPLVDARSPQSAKVDRRVVAVERAPSVPVCCIATDRADGLYVVGEQWVVTHNTTILLQACDGFAQDGRKAYFASGEMTREALFDYARRLGITNENITLFADPAGIDVRDLTDDVIATKSRLVILDSIQVARLDDVKGDVGKATMLDAVTNWMTSFAQAKNRAIIMIGHLQKEGNYAGTEQMQHLVDGLLRFTPEYAPDRQGVMRDTKIRKIWVDGKLRQGPADVTAYVELNPEGRIVTPSARSLQLAGLL